MKLKRWHLYLIATVVFIGVFGAINYKYDRFYRVNGINNDNRALIEQYLDESEQAYLIDNAIPVSKFIEYIEDPNFKLSNYEYYNLIKQTNRYSGSELISVTNDIVQKLTIQYGNNINSFLNSIISNDMISIYQTEYELFNFNNIEYYQLIRALYENSDYSFINNTNNYINRLSSYQVVNEDDVYQTIKDLCGTYSKDSLDLLLNTDLPEGTRPLYKINNMTSIINSQNYIASYSPEKLVLVENINRVNYSTYLQEDCYNALKQMYSDMYTQTKTRFILETGYVSYDTLLNQNPTIAGYSELQLGTSVRLRVANHDDQDFVNTEQRAWLNENAYKYGFVLRYPSDKIEITGHDTDNSLYRYVGIEPAKNMFEQNLCLEEYGNENNQ